MGPDRCHAGSYSDEYDCLLGLLGRLQRGEEPGKLSRYLRRQLSHHFGLAQDQSHPEQFAERVFTWYWADPLDATLPAVDSPPMEASLRPTRRPIRAASERPPPSSLSAVSSSYSASPVEGIVP
jgi:hypothetical protein